MKFSRALALAFAAAVGAASGAATPAAERAPRPDDAIARLIDGNQVSEAWRLLKEVRDEGHPLPDKLVRDFAHATLFGGGGWPLLQCGTGPRNPTGGGSFDLAVNWTEPEKLVFFIKDSKGQSRTVEAAVKLPLDWSADMPESAWVTVRAEWGPDGMKLYADGKLVGSNDLKARPGMNAADHVLTLGTCAFPSLTSPYFKGVVGDFRSSEDGRVKGFFVLRGDRSYVELGAKRKWKPEGYVQFKLKAMPYLSNQRKIEIPGVDPGAAAPPDPVPPELAEQARSLIAKLGDADWKTREGAAEALVKLGRKIRPLVAEAAKSHRDAEVRYRAAEVLEKLGDRGVVDVEPMGNFRPRLMTGP